MKDFIQVPFLNLQGYFVTVHCVAMIWTNINARMSVGNRTNGSSIGLVHLAFSYLYLPFHSLF